MKKVLCITVNTAIDYVIQVDHLSLGTTIRSTTATLAPSGKGVGVAIGVAILGGRAIATGFIGERSRDIFASLKAEKVEPMLQFKEVWFYHIWITEQPVKECWAT